MAGVLRPAHGNPCFVLSPLVWAKGSLDSGISHPTPELRESPTGNYGHNSFLLPPRPPLHSSLLLSHSHSRSCSFFLDSLSPVFLLSLFLLHTLSLGPHQLTCFSTKENELLRPPSLQSGCCFLTLALWKLLNLRLPQFPHL